MSAVLEPIGHDAIRTTLRSAAIQRASASGGSLHHAWLFAGPAGVGKFATARWWAALLKCPEAGACDPPCHSCRLVEGSVHPDVYETGPAPDKRSVGIGESRALLQRLSLRPTTAGPRVAIVREASTMTVEAQNALLKLLEEPPGSAVIVLVTDNVGAMLTTVRSRCRHEPFGALSNEEVVQVLARLGRTEDDARAAAACARGSVARALSLDADGLAEREAVLLAFEQVGRGQRDVEDVVKILVDRKESGYALDDLLEWQLGKVEAALGHPHEEPSPLLSPLLAESAAGDHRALLTVAERIQRTIDALARNANAKLVIRDLLLNVRI